MPEDVCLACWCHSGLDCGNCSCHNGKDPFDKDNTELTERQRKIG